jgi:thioesterase domain-containing protein
LLDGARESRSTIRREALDLTSAFELPEDGLESVVSRIFEDAFNLDRVGANDEFFELGGDSLLAETISLAIHQETGIPFPISRLSDCGSPRLIAKLLGRESASLDDPPAWKQSDPPPIFAVHGQLGFMLPRPAFLAGLRPGQQFRMFELPGVRGVGRSFGRIEEIAAAYVAQLTAGYPEGPIFLAAFCAGSSIALEMAAQLAAVGRPVRQLVLIDPTLPPRLLSASHRDSVGSNRWLNIDSADNVPQLFRTWFFKFRFWRQRVLGRPRDLKQKFPDHNFSIDAQAKLLAAYNYHRPPPFPGSAAILCSKQYREKLETSLRTWDALLPQRVIRIVGQTHRDVLDAATSEPAVQMQAIFDAARV